MLGSDVQGHCCSEAIYTSLNYSWLDPSNESEDRKHAEYDVSISQYLSDLFYLPLNGTKTIIVEEYDRSIEDKNKRNFGPYQYDEEEPVVVLESDDVDVTRKTMIDHYVADHLINDEVLLPQG